MMNQTHARPRSLLLVLTLILAGISLVCSKGEDAPSQKTADTLASEPKKKGRDSVVVTYVAQDTLSIFELLQQQHQVSYKSTTMGVFVYEIDSIANDDQTFWIYKVNDTMVPVASNTFHPRVGDTVSWHFRIMPR